MAEISSVSVTIADNLNILGESARFHWSWFMGERSYARLHRECVAFLNDLQFLENTKVGPVDSWASAALHSLLSASLFLKRRDIEGGWLCLHAAQRYALLGLNQAQVLDRAMVLLAESDKLPLWRAKAIERLLSDKTALTAHRLIEATRLRDDHDANQYHKIWLTADQLGILTVSCTLGLAFLLPLAMYFHGEPFRSNGIVTAQQPPSPWGFAMLCAVLVLGMFGGAFSVAQSIITDTSGARIPERVANHWVTFIRALFGSVGGLAGYAILRSNIINIKVGQDGDPVAISLAIAFLFGYTGERLIAKVADSVGGAARNDKVPRHVTETTDKTNKQ